MNEGRKEGRKEGKNERLKECKNERMKERKKEWEQHFHVKETFNADSDDVSVWELVDNILQFILK